MKVVEVFVGSLSHLSAKLPLWARLLLAFWIFWSGAVYFGWVELPVTNVWLRLMLMAPMVFVVLFLLTHMVVFVATWVSWPFKKAAKLVREMRNG